MIGIGINLASHPEGLGRAATHLAAHGVEWRRRRCWASWREAMQRWLGMWDCGAGFARVRAAWLQRGAGGREPHRRHGRERIAGTFLDLDDGGALSCGTRRARSAS